MENVRPKDVSTFIVNGVERVRGRSGGISTFASAIPQGSGRIWRLPAGSSYSDELHLENNYGVIGRGSPRRIWKLLAIAHFCSMLAGNFRDL
jgi:hypothetical protein